MGWWRAARNSWFSMGRVFYERFEHIFFHVAFKRHFRGLEAAIPAGNFNDNKSFE